MASSDIAIRVKNLNKSFKLAHEQHTSVKSMFLKGFRSKTTYEVQQVLKDISFEIKRGEFIGIVGRNGSGKSTLLKILGEIYQPTSGTVEVNGTLTPFIELGIGFNPELSGRENVYLNGAILGLTRKEIDNKYHEIVEFAELEKFMDKKLKNYSSGMQVRLAFSISMQAHNDILLIDEVLAVGDAAFQRKCFNTFRDIKKSGKTVVFVTHSMQNVIDFCDRAILIHDSEIVVQGDTEEVSTEYLKLNNDSVESTENNSKQGRRWGNNKAQITKVYDPVVTKDKITIKVDCVFNQSVEQPVFGFYIKDPQDRKIVESNTLWNGVETDTYVAQQEATLTWEVDNIFTNGTHQVTIALSDRSGTEFFDWWEEAIHFSIHKSAVTSAFTLPKQTIKLRVTK